MFGITNQTYTGEGDFLVGFCLVCRLQGGIYYFFFTKLQHWSSDQSNKKQRNEIKTKWKKSVFKEWERFILFLMTIDCITEKEVVDHQKMSENCCVDSMPLPDRTSYYRKPEFSFESEFGFRFIRNWFEKGWFPKWLIKCEAKVLVVKSFIHLD